MEYQRWIEYATFDDEGIVNGIAEDAPEDIKNEYKECLKEQEESEKNGIRLYGKGKYVFAFSVPIFKKGVKIWQRRALIL